MNEIPKQITVACFSPTEGTKNVSLYLASRFSGSVDFLDLTCSEQRQQTYRFSSSQLLIAACPVYAGQLPPVVGLLENLKGDRTPCILIAAYGNRHYDDTLAQMKERLTARGFVCIGGVAPIIPHIFSEKLGHNRPNTADEKILETFAKEMERKLRETPLVPADVPGNPAPAPKEAKPVPKSWKEDLCNGCLLCARNCPVDAIDEHTMEIDNSLCINCMSCARICPQEAREFDASGIRGYLEANYLEPREIETFL